MYLSLDWAKDWIKLPKDLETKQLALDFTMAIVEVEEVIERGANLKDIVVGKINEIAKHPDADRLEVCQVDIGDSVEQIVCGGINLSKGMLVAVAKVGSRVKWHGEGDLVMMAKTKIRGVESSGMIAAAEEIGLENLFPQKSDKEILDLSELKLKAGEELAEALELNDTIIDIDNKSINHRPDLWGQYGLARELAAIYKLKLKDYPNFELKGKNETKLKVTVEDKKNCFRYLGLAIKNIKVAESPWWLKKRLEAVGIRPINNIVDVTNYVMYELGQPMHAFDAKHIEGDHIIVKQAAKGEKFITLDGENRKLPEGALMIADAKKYVAIAGVMGGQNSEIGIDTSEIILESANFRAASVRRTATAIGLRSESSTRFEKSLDPVLAGTAIRRAAELILQLCPEAYIASKLVDVDNNPFKPVTLEVSEELINNRFGLIIPTAEIKDTLQRLKFDLKYKAKTFTIGVPSFRATKDISIPEDIVEEVARIYGYDNIKFELPKVNIDSPSVNLDHVAARDIKRWFSLSQKYYELYNYPFTNQAWAKKLGLELNNHLRVKNALSPEQVYLNMSLLPNLLARAEENMRWYDEFRIYELERTFDKISHGTYHTDDSRKKFLPKQDKYLAGVEVSKKSKEDLFLSIKGMFSALMEHLNVEVEFEESDIEYASIAYEIKYKDIILGQFGLLEDGLFDSNDVNVNVAFWQLNFTLLLKYINKVKKYATLAKFPAVYRDMAVVVDKGLKWADLEAEIVRISPLIRHLEPFDVFSGKGIEEGQKSIAWHLEFRSNDRTLLAEDVDKLMDDILAILQKKFKAILR
ncbi:MAG: phenylalanine--tRNA ligase subunit beta [Candidatus Komeilibacteria bacterium]|jgi:phenylalanyl-tRNA synthetase beta chain|nr:phenylalanine--tRNA ligase subunit beta [Candidatus Komeilibacteria bacterium]